MERSQDAAVQKLALKNLEPKHSGRQILAYGWFMADLWAYTYKITNTKVYDIQECHYE